MTDITLVEMDGNWSIPLTGCSINRCCVDWAVTLWVAHPAGEFALRIEETFFFVPAMGGEIRLDPEHEPAKLGPMLACTRTSVAEAVASGDGGLVVSFADGSSIKVPSSLTYEAWNLTGPHGLRVVSTPGGGLAIWQPKIDND